MKGFWRRFVVVACVCALPVWSENAAPKSDAEQLGAKQLDTLALINHINYVLEVIRTYHDDKALKDEYLRISADELNLRKIHDEKMRDYLRKIHNVLHSLSMNDRMREKYKRELTRDLDGVKIARMEKMAEIVAVLNARVSEIRSTAEAAVREQNATAAAKDAALKAESDLERGRIIRGGLGKGADAVGSMLGGNIWSGALSLVGACLSTGADLREESQRSAIERNRNSSAAAIAREKTVADSETARKRASDESGIERQRAAAEYRKTERAFQNQWEDKDFELDTVKLDELHKLAEAAMDYQWNLVNYYNIPDDIRVTGNDCKTLGNKLKVGEPKRRFPQLKNLEKRFKYYPPYWYYRAGTAAAIGEWEDVLRSCEKFEEANRSIFRRDKMSASIAMYKINALLHQKPNDKDTIDKDTIRECLDTICDTNDDSENIEQGIFCTAVYLDVLEDYECAREVLVPLMANLSGNATTEYREYCDLFTKGREMGSEAVPNTVHLVQCRMLLSAIEKKQKGVIDLERLTKICEAETTSSLEKLFYFGKLRVKDLWGYAEKDVLAINLREADGKLVAEIPVSWFLLGNMDIAFRLLKDGKPAGGALIGDDSRRSHVMSRPAIDRYAKDRAYVRVEVPVSADDLSATDGVRLTLNHISWPVEIRYRRSFREKGIFLPDRVESFMSQPIEDAKFDFEKTERDELDALRKAAERGDAASQYELGLRYGGVGVSQDQDLAEAIKWFRKAAEQGNADAQFILGLCYAEGEGVEKDEREAVKWCRKAADQGNADAQFKLGLCYARGNGVEKDEREAVKWYRKAADQGNADAQFALGFCYTRGNGVEKDEREAVRWFRKAADQGNADAQFALGLCYANGNGVDEDEREAVKWFRKAAEQGDADAQFALGFCYARGNGVEKDEREAVKWYRKAAEQGNKNAQENLRSRGLSW